MCRFVTDLSLVLNTPILVFINTFFILSQSVKSYEVPIYLLFRDLTSQSASVSAVTVQLRYAYF